MPDWNNKWFVYAYAVALIVLGFALIGGCGDDGAAESAECRPSLQAATVAGGT
ncbi:hypothetical protein [Paenibacillus sp. GYB003]|uniref:hypothetical protein n=1 Tax=Paenibacillus sp. GYB003 TaxID=2994392 RepID=UPI002F9695AC